MDGIATLEAPVAVERFSQGPSFMGSGTGNPEVDEKAPVIEIHFRRDPRLTAGPDECAWCEIDGHRFEIEPTPQRFSLSGKKLPRKGRRSLSGYTSVTPGRSRCCWITLPEGPSSCERQVGGPPSAGHDIPPTGLFRSPRW